ncbi:MAG TPA: DUF2157 domain-containing protein [Chitinophagaceae bacterium]|nr:DUF2157 domain-containing protein [Chitinophagaceae bacterium]
MALDKNLEELVAANVITEETALRISEYYRNKAEQPSNRFAIVLSILGSLLVGLGIVLVVAHNWDDLSPLVKTFFAFLPLVLGQSLCVFTLLKRKDSVAWRESSAAILFFAIAACISLISQIYHISGPLSGFLLTWILLGAPLIYVMRSLITGLLYIAVLTWYACQAGYFEFPEQFPYLYFPLLLVLLPAYADLYRNRHAGAYFGLYNWFIAISLLCVLGAFSTSGNRYEVFFAGYLALCCIYYLIGTNRFFERQPRLANPFIILGVCGILLILYLWSFDFLWGSGLMGDRPGIRFNTGFPYIAGALLLVSVLLFARQLNAKGFNNISPAGLSAVVYVFCVVMFQTVISAGVLLINAWIVFIALYYVRKGSIRHHLGILNLGLVIIALLAVMRFFDDSIPFVWRGIFFLVAGIGFFAGNYVVIRRKKAMALKQTE